MSCFCVASVTALSQPGLAVGVGAEAAASASAAISASVAAQAVLSVDAQVSVGVPGVPTGAPPNLPSPALSVTATAAVAARAQLQAQALAQCGIDLSTPLGATAIARLAATLDARFAQPSMPQPDLRPWQQLAALNAAAVRVAARQTGEPDGIQVITGSARGSDADGLWAATTPAAWAEAVETLRQFNIQATAAAQMNVGIADRASFVQAAQVLTGTALPELQLEAFMAICGMSSGLAAVAQLGASLGVNPVVAGFAQVQARVAANVSAAVAAMARAGVAVSASPVVPQVPGLPSFATPSAFQAVLGSGASATGAAEVQMRVDASVGAALAVTAFVANARAALGVGAASTPCGVCDSRAVMAAVSAGLSARGGR